MRSIKIFLIFVILIGGLAFQKTASAQVGTITQYSNETAPGIWLFNSANGKVSFCHSRVSTGGSPIAKCSLPAVTATSAAGFVVQLSEHSVWVISKSTEYVYQCSYYMANLTTSTPVVTCTQITTLSSMH